MRVLCFGSLNIDYTYSVPHFVARGETLSASARHIFCGGKGLNQSVALARAGLPVSLAGSIGEDGCFLLQALAGSGVDTRHVRVLPDVPTGHAIIQNDAGGDNCILVFGGANHHTDLAQAREVLADFGEGDVLCLQNEINALGDIIRLAKARGMRVVLTPAPMSPEIFSLPLELIDQLFCNEVEAGVLLRGEMDVLADPPAAAQALRARYGFGAVALTLGAEGSVYADGEQTLRQAACPAEVVDTTGAGDTFAGFFLAAKLEGKTPQEALLLGSAAASIAISRPGASPSIPTRAEVEQSLR